MEHFIHANLLKSRVRVTVVGAGGTGSHVVNGLVQLHTAMLALGHPGGLEVQVIDDDTVSESNVGRQAFVWSDIGQPKADVLVNRLNQAFGLDWTAEVMRLEPARSTGSPGSTDLVIGCVDNRKARKAIVQRFPSGSYYLDMGNRQNDGQIVLGELGNQKSIHAYGAQPRLRLPTVADLFPETVDDQLDAEDDQPSCSLADALEKQNLFINRSMALHGLNLLWRLFRHARIESHGAFVNLATDRVSPLAIDPVTWKRFGYDVELQSAA